MGLAAARQLQRYGIAFQGFELHSSVGGLWDINNPHSTVYQSAHLISSKGMTQFDEFPMPADAPSYPQHQHLAKYFRDYAEHFGLTEHYQFNTRVERIEPSGNGWRLISNCQGQRREWQFDGILLASGTLHMPNQPALPGHFSGELLHSAQYRDASIFAGKRVLVIGCGNSACDIAVDAVHRAASVDIAVRRGYHFLPKFILGKPTDTFGGLIKLPRKIKQWLDGLMIRALIGKPSQYGLPDPDYRLYESHPVINSLVLHHLGHGDISARGEMSHIEDKTVTFANGERAEYDLILQATGYLLDYPYIDRAQLNWAPEQAAPKLFLNTFHPEHDNLFVLGMVEASGLGWQGRAEQAELVALWIRAQQANTPAAQSFKRIKREQIDQPIDGGYQYLKLARMAYYVHKDSYRKALAKHANALKHGLRDNLPGAKGRT